MKIRKNFDLFSLFLYAPVWLIFICLSVVGNNAEPFGLALLFALCKGGLSPLLCAFGYMLSSLVHWDFTLSLVYALQALPLAIVFALCKGYESRRAKRKSGLLFPPFLSLCIGLLIFYFLAPFEVYFIPFDFPALLDVNAQKAVVCALVLLLSVLFSVSAYALLHKFLKCRLRVEEILFSALLYLITGVGFCRFFGFDAYLGVAFFILLLYCYVTKDASGVILSFLLGLPCALLGGMGLERFFILSVLVVLFCHTGKLGLCFALLSVLVSYAYLDGLLFVYSPQLLALLLSAIIPCALFLCLPNGLIRKLENELIFYREKHLSRIAINLGRAAVGGQLFELSSLFKEIQTTFSAIGDDTAEQNACAFIVNTVWQDCCRQCPSFRSCQAKGMKHDLQKLVEIGCLKGRTSLIDMTEGLAKNCDKQSDLLHFTNLQLADFRRFMTEAENAASGRELLASQAKGVSEILKNVALEQSQPLPIHTQAEKALSIALLKAGIVCSEIMLYGQEEDLTLSLITYQETDVKKITAVAKEVLERPLIISKRLQLSRDKCCFILRERPRYDAAFGVATRSKLGENACGDNYSVVKIDERRFMVALADGMGSGEYAQKISSCTLSLLESFYRAKMPSELILSTINKLLSFGKEESFTCVDIGVIDLDTGKADLIKIGTPSAFILSEKSMQILESSSLPLGILDTLRPDCASYTLKENEVLLFVSDGISGAFGSSADLYDLLKEASVSNPQRLADYVMESALQKYGDVAKDDMTVVAVRLFKPYDTDKKLA